jgi:hypothetical protein
MIPGGTGIGGISSRALITEPLFSSIRPMHAFLGLDEAGYGPNLGPLVISVTRWSLPSPAAAFDFYAVLAGAVSAAPVRCGTRLQIADSKQVYSPAQGLSALETSALALLRQRGHIVESLHGLWQALCGELPADLEPWFTEDLPLPLAADRGAVERLARTLADALGAAGAAVESLGSDIVQTERFNTLTVRHDSKGAALSHLTLGLLGRHWSPGWEGEALVVLDKHGGRNQYGNLLLSAFPDVFPHTLAEARECSRYRLGRHECRFQTKAEAHLPVAAASILSKYAREVAMEAFNRFWRRHEPGLKATKGYPEDAVRFRKDVTTIQKRLKISDNVFWRCR